MSTGGSGGPLRRIRDSASGAVWSSPFRHVTSMSNCIKRSGHLCILGDRFLADDHPGQGGAVGDEGDAPVRQARADLLDSVEQAEDLAVVGSVRSRNA